MFRILRNTFLTSRTGLKASAPLEEEEDALPPVLDTPESALLARVDHELLQSALEQLAAHYREVVLLCDVEEMSYQEIAETLGIPIGTVMSRLSRARKALRDLLRTKVQRSLVMSCELWHAKLEQYVDSELRGDEAAALEAHLRQCQSCAADALGRLRLKNMTHTAGKRFAPAPEFRLKITQQVARQSKPREWGWRLGWRLGAVAAILVAAISLGIFWTGHVQRERQLGELADLHVATLASANPVDVVSTDRHTVKPWFAGSCLLPSICLSCKILRSS